MYYLTSWSRHINTTAKLSPPTPDKHRRSYRPLKNHVLRVISLRARFHISGVCQLWRLKVDHPRQIRKLWTCLETCRTRLVISRKVNAELTPFILRHISISSIPFIRPYCWRWWYTTYTRSDFSSKELQLTVAQHCNNKIPLEFK